jgi:hypothetical protein
MRHSKFVQDKRRKRQQEQERWLCRTGAHYIARTMIAVQYGSRVGVCGNCIAKRCDRKPDGRLDLSTYWTRDWR